MWRTPNMTVTNPLVGGTVDSQESPVSAAKTETERVDAGSGDETGEDHRARRLEPVQEGGLRVPSGQHARGVRADDVEETDDRRRPGPTAGREPRSLGWAGRCTAMKATRKPQTKHPAVSSR